GVADDCDYQDPSDNARDGSNETRQKELFIMSRTSAAGVAENSGRIRRRCSHCAAQGTAEITSELNNSSAKPERVRRLWRTERVLDCRSTGRRQPIGKYRRAVPRSLSGGGCG